MKLTDAGEEVKYGTHYALPRVTPSFRDESESHE